MVQVTPVLVVPVTERVSPRVVPACTPAELEAAPLMVTATVSAVEGP